jgi:hypothetical protein
MLQTSRFRDQIRNGVMSINVHLCMSITFMSECDVEIEWDF